MIAPTRKHTLNDFITASQAPENAEKRLEYIAGEIVDVPSNVYLSEVAALIGFFLLQYIRANGIAGYVTGEQGGYRVNDDVYAPDVAYISAERQPTLNREGFNPQPPQLAVEVVSPTDSARDLRIKIGNYLAVGTVIWVVHPDREEVEVYVPGTSVVVYSKQDTLPGEPILPGFTLAVSELFITAK